jgi:hypothetical protein
VTTEIANVHAPEPVPPSNIFQVHPKIIHISKIYFPVLQADKPDIVPLRSLKQTNRLVLYIQCKQAGIVTFQRTFLHFVTL